MIGLEDLEEEDVGTLRNCRSFRQYVEMFSWLEDGCKFCKLDPNLNNVIAKNWRWQAWINPFPFKNTKLHIIIAHRKHITHIRECSILFDGFFFLWILMQLLIRFNVPGGGVVIRFGVPWKNAGTVRHLHANVMEPDEKGEVRPPLCKDPKEIEEDRKRMFVFEKMRLGTKLEELEPDDYELVKDRMK